MVIDTSAIVAIALNAPDAAELEVRIADLDVEKRPGQPLGMLAFGYDALTSSGLRQSA